MEYVQLVDQQDRELGIMEKMTAHREGKLHRAISVFLFNSRGELLLQQRAATKYHSSGLWTNTCCTHPRPGEPVADAAQRRLQEEMGVHASVLYRFHFLYKAELDQGLTEYELDHVFFAFSDQSPVPDPEEVSAWRYVSLEQLGRELALQPQQFTVWLQLIFDRVKNAHYELAD